MRPRAAHLEDRGVRRWGGKVEGEQPGAQRHAAGDVVLEAAAAGLRDTRRGRPR